MAFGQQVESLTEEVLCPFCLVFFTNPVTLGCGHNFCLSCITQCWEKEGRNCCPECRQEFADRSLRVNRALASLAEKVQKLNLNWKETEMRSQCEKHREELKLFCDTDKQLVCVICRDAREHRSHSFMPIEEAAEIYKCQVKSSFESLTEKKSAIQELERRQKQQISGVREQSHSLQANVTSEFAKIHQVLAEREQRLLSDLRAEEEKILNTMEKNLQEIEENLTSVEEKLSKLQKQMNEEDSATFLKEELCQDRRVSEEAPTLSVTEGAVTIGEFRDTILRGMFDAMKQVCETLDVESASTCLKGSEDLNGVRGTGTQKSLSDTGDSEEYNKRGDWGMKLLSEALRDPECKIQKLGLTADHFTSEFEHFISDLSTNHSLREVELDLSYSELGDWGIKLLSETLRKLKCKIQKLGLDSVGLTAAGVVDLTSALSTNRSLAELDLGYNELGDSGVKLVFEALRNPGCKIQKLDLESVGLTAAGVVDLTSALSTNRSLTELDLRDNELGDSGVKLVSEALRNPGCKIQNLCLVSVGLTAAGVGHLASALSTNRPLMELDLGDNELGDSGVKLLSAALRKPECKIQKLVLSWTGLTDSGIEDLVSGLIAKHSLRELELDSNNLTDRSVSVLHHLIVTHPCLEQIKLWGNLFSSDGENKLKSLEGTRPGLRVII
ncbi:ribonuclease inhibitor-like isoform X1 [Hypanus sabinus]|uniref:ribonuclease inhibitor-like isoform X1 n=2 Tax=Hypanus sabinus TaxID=79690 RepID=UPI0028C39C9C|nr:ribonuclease inhibitor-like isoform X1 [Hypanus sabinus]